MKVPRKGEEGLMLFRITFNPYFCQRRVLIMKTFATFLVISRTYFQLLNNQKIDFKNIKAIKIISQRNEI